MNTPRKIFFSIFILATLASSAVAAAEDDQPRFKVEGNLKKEVVDLEPSQRIMGNSQMKDQSVSIRVTNELGGSNKGIDASSPLDATLQLKSEEHATPMEDKEWIADSDKHKDDFVVSKDKSQGSIRGGGLTTYQDLQPVQDHDEIVREGGMTMNQDLKPIQGDAETSSGMVLEQMLNQEAELVASSSILPGSEPNKPSGPYSRHRSNLERDFSIRESENTLEIINDEVTESARPGGLSSPGAVQIATAKKDDTATSSSINPSMVGIVMEDITEYTNSPSSAPTSRPSLRSTAASTTTSPSDSTSTKLSPLFWVALFVSALGATGLLVLVAKALIKRHI